MLGDQYRSAIDKLVYPPINSTNSINISLDKPMNMNTSLNIERLVVLRQYFGKNVNQTVNASCRSVSMYTYGSDKGS